MIVTLFTRSSLAELGCTRVRPIHNRPKSETSDLGSEDRPLPNGERWSLHPRSTFHPRKRNMAPIIPCRSEEHTSELQSRRDLVCRLLLEKKKKNIIQNLT